MVELDGTQREALVTVLQAVFRDLTEVLNGAHITAQKDPRLPMEDLRLVLGLAARRQLADDESKAVRVLEGIAGL